MPNDSLRHELERRCYGLTVEEMNEQIKQGVAWYDDSRAFLAISMLSDAQEMLAMARTPQDMDKIRQLMNQVKYIISAYYDAEREARHA